MQQGIPSKGEILTYISNFWFDFTSDIIENHIVSTNVDEYPQECREYSEILKGRSMLVKKAKLIPLECIVRGYLSGTGWNDYKKTGAVCGIALPPGLEESEKLPKAIFTPSTKADIGDHDENITKALEIYIKASEYALTKGIIIADTKMEFGIYNNKVILIDELLTPDSSRFWPLDSYEKGRAQDSYDKQYVRDYLLSINFNKRPPAPILPESVITNTANKYFEAVEKLTGKKLEK